VKNRTLLILLLINSLIGVAVAVWINVFTGAELTEYLKSAGLYEYRGRILIVFIILSLISLVLVFRHEHAVEETPKTVNVSEAEILKATRDFLQDLMARYQTRYQHKLDGRFEISLLVSEDLEGTDEQQFDEEFSADPQTGSAAQYIIELFEKRGRLLIVGSPGVGKTVLLLKLALHLIAKAQSDTNQPLPVIFNLASWSPEYERFDDWLKAVLTQGYGLSPDFAAATLREGRIVFLLDGLDELARNEEPDVAAEVRKECLTALNLSLYDGTKNAVICCRREEFIAMRNLTGAEGPVAAKVAVQDLTIGQIERALIRASRSEKDRFAALHLLEALGQDRNGAYRQVLTTPFYFTLALHVFDYSEPPQIAAPDKQTLERNLMKGFIEKKIQVTENKEHFSVAQVFKWLAWLARFLDVRQQVVFELADLQRKTLKRPWWDNVAHGVIIALLLGVPLGIGFGMPFGLIFGFIMGLIFPWQGSIQTEDIARWSFSPLLRLKAWRRILLLSGTLGFSGIGAWGLIVLVNFMIRGRVLDSLRVVPTLVLAYAFLYGLFSVCRQISSFAKLSKPYQRLRAGILFNVLHLGGSLSIFSLAVVLLGWLQINWFFPIVIFIIGSLLGFSFTALWRHCVLRFCLTLEGSMPFKYVSFLRYATELRILEEEGGQWRFRHQNFQDYFADPRLSA
jgi:MFS family permease